MGTIRKRALGSAGFTLMEVMIAGGILAFIAIAVMPAIFEVSKGTKTKGFKAQCTAFARAKLQEYTTGVADQRLFPGAQASGFVPSGFDYTKRRYQNSGQFTSGANVCSTNPTASAPGYRESIFNNDIIMATTRETDASGNPVAGELLGFQLWVLIRHYNPRVLTDSGQPSRQCPAASYQYLQVGDALEVTVTGMIRTLPNVNEGGRGTSPFGNYRDVDANTPHPQLTCSVTDVVYPPVLPFRYFMAPDGMFYNLQAKLSEGTADPTASPHASQAHFRNVWSIGPVGAPDGAARTPSSGIKSIVVSPDNKYVWVLRTGEIARYGPCAETATTVTVNSLPRTFGGTVNVDLGSLGLKTLTGMPDCPPGPSIANTANPDGLTWTTQANIEKLAVNFNTPGDPSDDKLYGMFGVGGGSSSTAGTIQEATPDAVAPHTIDWSASSAYSIPADRPRIQGFFIAQKFPATAAPNLFFFNNDCYNPGSPVALTAGTDKLRNCTSFYSASDSNMQQSMREMPLQVEAVSY
jgi:type II secretory pathway pseudopilin PulG